MVLHEVSVGGRARGVGVIVCIGDSITAGQYLPPDKAWPQQLSRMTGRRVKNAGVANETTRQGLERFPRHVQDVRPDALVIQFGLNDCNRWKTDRGLTRVSRSAYAANLREMVTRAFAFDVATVVIAGLTPTRKSDQHYLDALAYHGTAEGTAAQMLVEFYDCAGITEDHLIDDVHLSEEGHRIYAEGVARCLNLSCTASIT